MDFELYDGDVRLYFQESSHRYQVSVREGKSWSKPRKVVGVSSVLNTLNKPSLMTWPMVEALKHLGCKLRSIEGRFVWFLPNDLTITESMVREAAKAYQKKGDDAKDTGKSIHASLEKYLRNVLEGGENQVDEEALIALDNFVEWMAEMDAKPIEVEKVLYSREYDFAGTCDFVFNIQGKTILGDFKTSKISKDAPQGIYSDYFFQMGAYSLAYTEMTGKTIDGLLGINIDKKTGKVMTLSAFELGWNVADCERAFKDLLNVYRFHSRTANFIRTGKRLSE